MKKQYLPWVLLCLILAGLSLGAMTTEDLDVIRVENFGPWVPGKTFSSSFGSLSEIGNFDLVNDGERFYLSQRMGFDNWSTAPTPSATNPSLFYLYKNPANEYLCAGVGGDLYYSNLGTWTNATSGIADVWDDGGTASPLATAITFKDTMIAAGNDKAFWFYNGTASNLTTWGYPILCLHQDRIYAAGNSTSPNKIIWRPEFWIDFDSIDTKYNSGFVYVGEDDGEVIRALVSMQNYLIVFKDHSIFRITISPTTNEPYEIIRVHSSIGTLNPRTVTEYNNALYFVNDYGVYVFDGQGVTKLSDLIDSWFADSVVAIGGTVSDFDEFGIAAMENRLYVTTKEQGSTDVLLVYDMKSGYWWKQWFPVAIGGWLIPYQSSGSATSLSASTLPSLGSGTKVFQRPRFFFWDSDTVYIYPWGPLDWSASNIVSLARSARSDLGDAFHTKQFTGASAILDGITGSLAMALFADTTSGSTGAWSVSFPVGSYSRVRNRAISGAAEGAVIGWSVQTASADSLKLRALEFRLRRNSIGSQN